MRILLFILLIFIKPVVAQQWQAVPLVTQEIKDAGHFGGEGCQWPQAIEVDATDGSFLLFGTDVGGIYRSTDGGKMWEPCNVGYNPRGNCGFAIDPNNNQRALAIGGNSTENYSHGIYLTTDQATSWKHVYQETDYDGYRGFKDKVAYDKSSFDIDSGYSMTAYWSNPAGGLYKSNDGGESWFKINDDYGNCIIKVDPGNGTLYAGNNEGLYQSVDEGGQFNLTLHGEIRDISVIHTDSVRVWISTPDGLYVSENSGKDFTKIESMNYPDNVIALQICPSNPNKMVVCQNAGNYDKPVYYSEDAGMNWNKAQMNSNNAFMPFNGRTHEFAWHPTEENKLWAFGGDWITSSNDGGQQFEWDANGFTGILVGGMFNFNLFNTDILYVASQDYNGAVTFDNGETWKYCNASGHGWGGFTYGAYAANENILVTQVSEGWNEDGILTISRDGGNTFTKTAHVCNGLDVGCGDPKDSSVIYFCNWVSHDAGISWTEMVGCNGVLIANLYDEKEVYGANGVEVVKSSDFGQTWEPIVTLPTKVMDVAIDHVRNRLYIAANDNRLFYYEDKQLTEITRYLPEDQYGNIIVKTVAVDPVEPTIVYVAAPRNVYATDASVMRSRDAGFSWEIMTRNTRTNNHTFGKDGAREAFALRVNAKTRELWATGGCYGIWKIGKPDTVPYSFPVIRLNKNHSILKIDESLQLKVKASYKVDTTTLWSSSDTVIASVDNHGLVTAKSQGKVTITAKIIETGEELECIILVQGTKTPYKETGQIPGIVEAENFDKGGEGVSYHDATFENSGGEYRENDAVDIEVCSEGGYNIGWTEPGEWLSYTINIDSTAKYDINARIASASDGGTFSVFFSESNDAPEEFSFDATGGWQNWETITKKEVPLNAGKQEMKINILSSGFNLNYLNFSYAIPDNIINLQESNIFEIHPNPLINGKLQIVLNNNSQSALITIYSMFGKMVYEKKTMGNEALIIEKSIFTKGIYLVCLSHNSFFTSKKLVVQ